MKRLPWTGPVMFDVLRYVAAHPGCTNQQVAVAVGPNGSHAYGDRAVKRCYRRALIRSRDTGGPGHAYAWELTGFGRVELEAGTVRRDDIRALRDAAGTAGDLDQVALCDHALAGAAGGPCWQVCARVIAAHRLETRTA